MATPHDVMALLLEWRGADDEAVHRLVPLVREELRRLARRHMVGDRSDLMLQVTALVNQVDLRLAAVLKISEETVMRDWRFAKNWLIHEMCLGTRLARFMTVERRIFRF